MSDHPIVTVKLNSGTYKAILKGKVSAVRFSGPRLDRSAMYEVELIDHKELKTIHVSRDQIVMEDNQ